MKHRSGYTLFELTISVGVAGILIVGMASALVVSTKAVATPATVVEAQDSSDLVREFLEDSQHAIYILEHTNKTFEFALTDMDGDDLSDIVRYEWSGTAGDPLHRTFNGGSQVVVAANVQSFDLDYIYRNKVEVVSLPPTTSSEVLLASFMGAGSTSDENVEYARMWGQYFKPTFPSGSVDSWEITKVMVKLKQAVPVFGIFKVQIYPAAGSIPSSTYLASVDGDEFDLAPTMQWETLHLVATDLDPNAAFCLVVARDTWTPAQIRYENGGISAPDSWLLKSIDQGANWTTESTMALHYQVYGKYTSSGSGTTDVTRRYLTGVRASMQMGTSESANIVASVPLLNTPETVDKVWQLDFDSDPTAKDVNFDSTADWASSPAHGYGLGGAPFNTSTLENGLWQPDSTLSTRPLTSITKPVTVTARMRALATGGGGAEVIVPYSQSGNNVSNLAANVILEAEGTQSLIVQHQTDFNTWTELTRVEDLPKGFVDARFVIVPSSHFVNVQVNGIDKGSYATPTIWLPTVSQKSTIGEDSTDAEFDYVSIRISDPD